MYLVVGLGNPGSQYERTRHNAGFDVLELFAERLGARMGKLRAKAKLGEAFLAGEKVVLAQPQTFMNLSGESVRGLVDYYGIEIEKLIVCYDDVDLPAGKLRVRAGGSAGTHNGMRSIIYLLGRDDFPRVRVGIGKQPPNWDLADYVLSHYETPEARKVAFESYVEAARVIEILIREGVGAATRAASAYGNGTGEKPEKPPASPKQSGTD